MRSRFPRIATAAGFLIVTLSLGLLFAQPDPARAPIALHYRETPIFLGPHEHWVAAIAFSPDGKTLATGANDGYLRLWDSATGRLRSIHSDDATRGIQGLAFSQLKAAVEQHGAKAGGIVVLDMTTGEVLALANLPT